jgi:hypothetical protein
VVDRGIKPRSGQTKDYKIGISEICDNSTPIMHLVADTIESFAPIMNF